jgi:hypothetical protein
MFGVIYGADTVQHILSGKAYARAVRAHCLLQGALMTLLLQHILPGHADDQTDAYDNTSVTETDDMQVRCLITNVLKESHSVASSDTLEDQVALKKIEVALDKIKLHLSEKSITARLWIQYIPYVGVVKQFLTAERICNWRLHLASVTEMLFVCSYRS